MSLSFGYKMPGGSPAWASSVQVLINGSIGGIAIKYPLISANTQLEFGIISLSKDTYNIIKSGEPFNLQIKKINICEWEEEKVDPLLEEMVYVCNYSGELRSKITDDIRHIDVNSGITVLDTLILKIDTVK